MIDHKIKGMYLDYDPDVLDTIKCVMMKMCDSMTLRFKRKMQISI